MKALLLSLCVFLAVANGQLYTLSPDDYRNFLEQALDLSPEVKEYIDPNIAWPVVAFGTMDANNLVPQQGIFVCYYF
jgi:hypothetical protein